MQTRKVVSFALACLLATTLFTGLTSAQELKKALILKGIVGAGLLLKYLKPKKGILPIPLPLPLPLPIEFEQPPVVVHPKPHPVPVHHPVPVPVHVPVTVPIHHHHKQLDIVEPYAESYGGSYGGYGDGY